MSLIRSVRLWTAKRRLRRAISDLDFCHRFYLVGGEYAKAEAVRHTLERAKSALVFAGWAT